MKKTLTICLAGLLAASVLLTGCGEQETSHKKSKKEKDSTSSSEKVKSGKESSEESSVPTSTSSDAASSEVSSSYSSSSSSSIGSSSFSDSDFTVKEYLYVGDYESASYFVVVTNNTNKTVSISSDGKALDKSGKELDSTSMYISALGPGETSIGNFYFYDEDIENIDKVDYDLDITENTYYEPVLKDIKTEETKAGDNIVVSVKNNGSNTASSLYAYALLFDSGDKLVGYSTVSFYDAMYEVKPGATLYGMITPYEKYDHYELYFTGYSSGTSYYEATTVKESDFTVKTYTDDSYSSTSQYLVMTNNSKETVSVTVNAAAKDKSGKPIAAGNGSITAIGPGETSVASVYFSSTEASDIDKVDYYYSFAKQTSYSSVIKDIDVKSKKTDDGVEVTLTNNGTIKGDYVYAYVFFFTKDNKVADVNYTYFTDGDGELKPGKSITEEIYFYGDSFDHFEIYLVGDSYISSSYDYDDDEYDGHHTDISNGANFDEMTSAASKD